jgi:DNA-binding response OmpR family regulator
MAHVLVVEDDRSVFEVIEGAVSSEPDFSVSLAATGRAALSSLATVRPDLVLVNDVIPAPSGIAVARHAASLEVPVLLMTGNPLGVERAKTAGYPLLMKPFLPSQLLERMRGVLADAAARQSDAQRTLAEGWRACAEAEELRTALEEARAETRHAANAKQVVRRSRTAEILQFALPQSRRAACEALRARLCRARIMHQAAKAPEFVDLGEVELPERPMEREFISFAHDRGIKAGRVACIEDRLGSIPTIYLTDI